MTGAFELLQPHCEPERGAYFREYLRKTARPDMQIAREKLSTLEDDPLGFDEVSRQHYEQVPAEAPYTLTKLGVQN